MFVFVSYLRIAIEHRFGSQANCAFETFYQDVVFNVNRCTSNWSDSPDNIDGFPLNNRDVLGPRCSNAGLDGGDIRSVDLNARSEWNRKFPV